MIVVIFGAPGAGKGTQSKHIVSNYGFVHISTGELLRNEVRSCSALGKKIDAIMKNGGLIDDSDINEIISSKVPGLLKTSNVLLDGYPRTVSQAKFLDSVLFSLPTYNLRVIQIDVDVEVLIERISGRLVCKECGATCSAVDKCEICGCMTFIKRSDDEPSVVTQRIEKYNKVCAPVLDYWHDVVYRVSGNGNCQEVSDAIDRIMTDDFFLKRIK